MRIAAFLTDVVDRDEVGMWPQPGHRLRLAHDSFAGQLVQAVRSDLGEGHVAVEGRVVGQEDPFPPAFAEEPFDSVAAGDEG